MTSSGTTISTGFESHLDKAISRVFWTAVILTGSSTFAESVVGDCIEYLDIEDLAGECFLTCVLTLSLQRSPSEPNSHDAADAIVATLPLELQLVLELPTFLRHAFTLRMLLGLPVEQCSRLLHVQPEHIAERVFKAIHELAALDPRGSNGIGNSVLLMHASFCDHLAGSRVQ